MMMNSTPNFDIKNPRDYSGYDNVQVPLHTLSTAQRIAKSFNRKVFFWSTLAILSTLDLFVKPLLIAPGNNIAEIRLLFAAGLALGMCEGIAWQKRSEAPVAPLWRRIVLGIITLAALIVAFHFLGDNAYILSLCAGAVAGSAAWYAVVAFRSNWAAYS